MESKEELFKEYREVNDEIEKIRKEKLSPLYKKVEELKEKLHSDKNIGNDRVIWSIQKCIYILEGEIEKIVNNDLYKLHDQQYKLFCKIMPILNEEKIIEEIEELRKKNNNPKF